jgi:biopolymer transport protein ExbB/TolQ
MRVPHPIRAYRGWPRADRIVLASLVTFWVAIGFMVAIELQVQARNERLDEFAKVQQQLGEDIKELSVSVSQIALVAEDVASGDPEMTRRLADVFAKVDEIYQVVVVEGGE